MRRRKDEQTIADLQRDWPHHVALPVEKVLGAANSETVRAFARTLSAAQLTYMVGQGDAVVVMFCFKMPEDARVFAERFGGELLAAG
jgi:hypothetical protein